jgi:glycosyltransferase involved in cell wall biosynthesis
MTGAGLDRSAGHGGEEAAVAASGSSTPMDSSTLMLVGGFFGGADRGEDRPRNDVDIMRDEFGATIRDFSWLEGLAAGSIADRLLVRFARRTGQWSAVLALRTASEVRRHDIVYISGEDVGVVACAASRLLGRRPPAFVLRVERPIYGRTRLRRAVYRRLLRFASRPVGVAICRTSALAEVVRHETHLPPDRVISFGQEIDTDYFDPASEPRSPAPEEPPFVLSAGLERRDYDTLLAAVEDLPITLVIASGSPWSKDRFDTDRTPGENVIVNSYDRDQMRELYRRAQLVVLSVLPTDRACGMNVVGEAWAMGRPVVCTATTGLTEYVVDGENGLLVPPGDPAGLRRAILAVLQSEHLADRLGSAGQAYVRSELSLGRFRSVVDGAMAVAHSPDRQSMHRRSTRR